MAISNVVASKVARIRAEVYKDYKEQNWSLSQFPERGDP